MDDDEVRLVLMAKAWRGATVPVRSLQVATRLPVSVLVVVIRPSLCGVEDTRHSKNKSSSSSNTMYGEGSVDQGLWCTRTATRWQRVNKPSESLLGLSCHKHTNNQHPPACRHHQRLLGVHCQRNDC